MSEKGYESVDDDDKLFLLYSKKISGKLQSYTHIES